MESILIFKIPAFLIILAIVSRSSAQAQNQPETQIELSPVFRALQAQAQGQGEPSAQAQYQGHPQYPNQQYAQQQQQQYPPQQPGYPQQQQGYPQQPGYPPPGYNNQPQQYPGPYPPNQPGFPQNQPGYPNQQPGIYPQPGFNVPQQPSSFLGKSCVHTKECDAANTLLTCHRGSCVCPSREQSMVKGKYPLHTMWDQIRRQCMSVKGAACDVHHPKVVYCQQGLECKSHGKDPVGKCAISGATLGLSVSWTFILISLLGYLY